GRDPHPAPCPGCRAPPRRCPARPPRGARPRPRRRLQPRDRGANRPRHGGREGRGWAPRPHGRYRPCLADRGGAGGRVPRRVDPAPLRRPLGAAGALPPRPDRAVVEPAPLAGPRPGAPSLGRRPPRAVPGPRVPDRSVLLAPPPLGFGGGGGWP